MKTPLPLLLAAAAALPALSLRADAPPSRFEQKSGKAAIQIPAENQPAPESRAEAGFLQALKEGVQLTELGCMRAVFVFDPDARVLETRVTEAFSNADFRVFPKGQVIEGRLEPKALHQIGNDRLADLVVFTRVSARPKPKLGPLHLIEAEATVQVFNPMSEELLVSHTARQEGQRHTDPEVAARSAFEGAADAAVREAIAKTLEKAHKILVHEAQLKGVQDHQHLLEIMEHTARLQGVYHVRQLSYDKTTGLAVIEILGAPQTESFWRAHLQNLPKREQWTLSVQHIRIQQNEGLRQKNPDWTE